MGGAAAASRAQTAPLCPPLTCRRLPRLPRPSRPQTMSPSIYIRHNTTLASVLLTLAAVKTQQLYFVDASTLAPLGVVRVADLLKLFMDGL